MSKKIQTKIQQYLLRLIGEEDKNYVSKTMETFNVSKSTVYNYLKTLKEEKLIEKKGKSYVLKTESKAFIYNTNEKRNLDEASVFQKDIHDFLRELPDNVYRAWRYAFTEMMNNAIEHSGASSIVCVLQKDYLNTSIIIADNGVGIFRNIQNYLREKENTELTLSECAAVLLAGKFTTAKERHSGEGIFFTSHIMDNFMIISDSVIFSRTNFSDVQTNYNIENNSTVVYMQLSNKSTKTVTKIFDRFSSVDEGFFRTQIPIAHMFPYGGPVSRSEARRLGEIISKFKEVVLDFAGVAEVGQAFTHELFIVWQRDNPDIKIKTENTGADVSKMIKRVLNT